jgi:hypothetical protein
MAVGTPILASHYNAIRELVAGRLGSVSVYVEYGSLTTPLTTSGGYGRNFTSDIVVGGSTPGVSDIVTEDQHFNLWLDLQAGHNHCYGSLATDIDPTEFEGKTTFPDAADFASRDLIAWQHKLDLDTIADTVLAFNHASTEFPSSSFTGLEPLETTGGTSTSSTRTTQFGGSSDAVKTISHEVTVNFGSHSNLIYYLAAGGEILFQASASGGSTGTPNTKDWDWAQTLSGAGTIRFRRRNQALWECEAISPGSGTGYSNASIGSGTTWTKVFEKFGGSTIGNPGIGDPTGTSIYDDNVFRIYARTNSAFSTATSLQFKIEVDDADTGTGGQSGYPGETDPGSPVDESVTANITSTVYTKTPNSTFVYDGVTYNGIVLETPTGVKNSDF